MKICFKVLFSLFCLFSFSISSNCLDVKDVSAEAAVIICADSKEIVFEKNSNTKLPMASTTKIMTSILALEFGASDYLHTVTDNMVSVEGSSIGLLPNDKISLKTLVKGMLLESGNDAANSVAHIIGGNIENFVFLMNNKAKEIGMSSTSFETPSGLDGDNHFSTAYDMAVLGAYAIENPEFRDICSSKEQVVYYGNEPYRRVFSNNNKLLEMYDGALGIKTGFTKKSGRCLVSAVEKDGVTLVAVTLNAPNDWNDHIKMYDYSFPIVKKYKLDCNTSDFKVNVVGGNKTNISVVLGSSETYSQLSEFECKNKIFIESFLYAPVQLGDIVGFVEFYNDKNEKISEISLIAAEGVEAVVVEKDNRNFFDKIIDFFR